MFVVVVVLVLFFFIYIPHYTATEDEDFTGLPDIIVFEAGDFEGAMSCKNITIIDDNIREGVENFTVMLSSDFDGVTVSRGLAVVEISDNDGGIHVVKIIRTSFLKTYAVNIILCIYFLIKKYINFVHLASFNTKFTCCSQ